MHITPASYELHLLLQSTRQFNFSNRAVSADKRPLPGRLLTQLSLRDQVGGWEDRDRQDALTTNNICTMNVFKDVTDPLLHGKRRKSIQCNPPPGNNTVGMLITARRVRLTPRNGGKSDKRTKSTRRMRKHEGVAVESAREMLQI